MLRNPYCQALTNRLGFTNHHLPKVTVATPTNRKAITETRELANAVIEADAHAEAHAIRKHRAGTLGRRTF